VDAKRDLTAASQSLCEHLANGFNQAIAENGFSTIATPTALVHPKDLDAWSMQKTPKPYAHIDSAQLGFDHSSRHSAPLL
jgi:hypothetical protein